MDGTITASGVLRGTLSSVGTLLGELALASEQITPIYTGSYEWTPTNSTQTIELADEKASANIIINPIPSNYGLITWDGTKITVS